MVNETKTIEASPEDKLTYATPGSFSANWQIYPASEKDER
jgi:hypothetical protein